MPTIRRINDPYFCIKGAMCDSYEFPYHIKDCLKCQGRYKVHNWKIPEIEPQPEITTTGILNGFKKLDDSGFLDDMAEIFKKDVITVKSETKE